jgi:hypothetical protein
MSDLEYQSGNEGQYERRGILRKLFGPSTNEIWNHFAQQLGGSFRAQTFWTAPAVRAEHGEWTILLDTHTVSTGKSSVTYTRLRAPFVNSDRFYFELYRASIFSNIGKFFGMQDVTVSDPTFCREFIIKSNDEQRIQTLLEDETLRTMIRLTPDIQFALREGDKGFKAEFPQGVDQLHFLAFGVIRDLEMLHSLFNLFGYTLNLLCHFDSAYEDDPSRAD